MLFLKSYTKNLIRHKWFVFLECCKAGIPWLGLIHDLSKFRQDEFIPYATFDFNKKRNESGYYKPTDTGNPAFDYAWFLHQKRNKHHWQWWCLPDDGGGLKALDMPLKYRKEMVCDWRGAGRAYGGSGAVQWYVANSKKIKLSPATQEWVEKELGIKKWAA